jgi:hypothetical protein
MNRKRSIINRIASSPLLYLGAVLATLQPAQAAVTLVGMANFNTNTNVYDYSYSVTNTEPMDVVLVSIPAAMAPASMIGALTAPAGFSITYDPSQGWINLNEDNDIFTDASFAPNSTNGPFTFSTPIAPVLAFYQAFDAGGNEYSGAVVAPVPEASTALLTLPLGLLALRRSRPNKSAINS